MPREKLGPSDDAGSKSERSDPISREAAPIRDAVRAMKSPSGRPDVNGILALQRIAGNRATAALLRSRTLPPGKIHEEARTGVSSGGGPLPHLERIQRAFGQDHDLSSVRAHVGGPADLAAERIGARAYTLGNAIAFRSAPTLAEAAHEAAHVVQQRRGVQIPGGVGQVGDPHERHADAVAERVVQGRPASPLLGPTGTGPASSPSSPAVQRLIGFELELNVLLSRGTPWTPEDDKASAPKPTSNSSGGFDGGFGGFGGFGSFGSRPSATAAPNTNKPSAVKIATDTAPFKAGDFGTVEQLNWYVQTAKTRAIELLDLKGELLALHWDPTSVDSEKFDIKKKPAKSSVVIQPTELKSSDPGRWTTYDQWAKGKSTSFFDPRLDKKRPIHTGSLIEVVQDHQPGQGKFEDIRAIPEIVTKPRNEQGSKADFLAPIKEAKKVMDAIKKETGGFANRAPAFKVFNGASSDLYLGSPGGEDHWSEHAAIQATYGLQLTAVGPFLTQMQQTPEAKADNDRFARVEFNAYAKAQAVAAEVAKQLSWGQTQNQSILGLIQLMVLYIAAGNREDAKQIDKNQVPFLYRHGLHKMVREGLSSGEMTLLGVAAPATTTSNSASNSATTVAATPPTATGTPPATTTPTDTKSTDTKSTAPTQPKPLSGDALIEKIVAIILDQLRADEVTENSKVITKLNKSPKVGAWLRGVLGGKGDELAGLWDGGLMKQIEPERTGEKQESPTKAAVMEQRFVEGSAPIRSDRWEDVADDVRLRVRRAFGLEDN